MPADLRDDEALPSDLREAVAREDEDPSDLREEAAEREPLLSDLREDEPLLEERSDELPLSLLLLLLLPLFEDS